MVIFQKRCISYYNMVQKEIYLFNNKVGFTEDLYKYILLNILNVVEALHKAGIYHRDLKPENIVFV